MIYMPLDMGGDFGSWGFWLGVCKRQLFYMIDGGARYRERKSRIHNLIKILDTYPVRTLKLKRGCLGR